MIVRVLLGIALAVAVISVAFAQTDDPCAAQRDHYIALASLGPPQDAASQAELAAALDALFTCHNAGTSIYDFGNPLQFFATPTPTPTPHP